MIIRAWRGYVAAGDEAAYITHFRSRVLPSLGKIPGFQGASLLKQYLTDRTEFLVLTRWDSMKAVRKFAGGDATKAVVAPDAAALLLDFERTVHHYEVVDEFEGANPPTRSGRRR